MSEGGGRFQDELRAERSRLSRHGVRVLCGWRRPIRVRSRPDIQRRVPPRQRFKFRAHRVRPGLVRIQQLRDPDGEGRQAGRPAAV